jgi:purine-cytosine permease-like protein
MTTREIYRNPKVRRWFWVGVIALVALQLYYVREMLALLILFAAFFAVATAIVLALYLVNRAGQFSLSKVEPYAVSAARAGRRGLGFVGEVSRRPFRRQHSETAP